jgi:hypothetical protein
MEFRNKPFPLRPVGVTVLARRELLHVREPTKRSRGSIGAAADDRSQPVGRMFAADRYRKSPMRMRPLICADFRHHGSTRTPSFPPKFFPQLRPPNKINYLAIRWQEWRAYHRPRESTRCNQIQAFFDPRKYWRSHKIVTPKSSASASRAPYFSIPEKPVRL